MQRAPFYYDVSAFFLGLVWYLGFLISPSMQKLVTAKPMAAPVFMIAGYLIARIFRRHIVRSQSLRTDVLLAIALPCLVITTAGIGVWLFNFVHGPSRDALWLFFATPFLGLVFVLVSSWYVILPVGLIAQLSLKRLGRLAWPELIRMPSPQSE